MNRKLISLAVAAALVAPAAAMADAVLYGKLNVSLDYQSIENVIAPVYNDSATGAYVIPGSNPPVTVTANPGVDYFVGPDGSIATYKVGDRTFPVTYAPGQPLSEADSLKLRGYTRLLPGKLQGGQDFNGWGMSRNPGWQGEGRASRIGVKGSEDLGGGLKAVYQVEFGINLNDTNGNPIDNGDSITYRNTFVGLAGGWGTALMGRHDTPLKISTGKLDLFSDTMADYNGTIGFQDLRADNAIAYISPSFSGLTVALATVAAGGGIGAGTGSGLRNINSDQINGAYSLAAIYSNGPFYASAAYEVINQEMFNTTGTSLGGCFSDSYSEILNGVNTQVGTSFSCPKVEDDLTKWRLGLGLLDWNGFSLTGIYEHQDLPTTPDYEVWAPPFNVWNFNTPAGTAFTPGRGDSRDLWQIQAGYRFGNVQLKAMYGESKLDGSYAISTFGATPDNAAIYSNLAKNAYENETSSWAVGVDYNFSKRTMVYALYTATESDQNGTPIFTSGASAPNGTGRTVSAWDGFSLGMMHSF